MTHHREPLKDAPMLIIEPAALFARTLEIAEVYEDWLEAQVQMFRALSTYSAVSLRLFRAFSGRGVEGRRASPIRPVVPGTGATVAVRRAGSAGPLSPVEARGTPRRTRAL